MTISIIVAHAQNRVIGQAGEIPWYIRDDMVYFKESTVGKVVIMGRKTYESIPEKHRPFKDRLTYVITRNCAYTVDSPIVKVFQDFDKAMFSAVLVSRDSEVMIAGGAEIYRLALPYTDRVYATILLEDHEGDTYFPQLPGEEWDFVDSPSEFADEQLNLLYKRCIYQRKRTQ